MSTDGARQVRLSKSDGRRHRVLASGRRGRGPLCAPDRAVQDGVLAVPQGTDTKMMTCVIPGPFGPVAAFRIGALEMLGLPLSAGRPSQLSCGPASTTSADHAASSSRRDVMGSHITLSRVVSLLKS